MRSPRTCRPSPRTSPSRASTTSRCSSTARSERGRRIPGWLYAGAVAIAVFFLLQASFDSWRLAVLSFLILPVALSGGALVALAVERAVRHRPARPRRGPGRRRARFLSPGAALPKSAAGRASTTKGCRDNGLAPAFRPRPGWAARGGHGARPVRGARSGYRSGDRHASGGDRARRVAHDRVGEPRRPARPGPRRDRPTTRTARRAGPTRRVRRAGWARTARR